MDSATASFGDRLRQLRQAAGFSQEELAERAGLSLRGISDLERGVRRVPHLTTVLLLADGLALGAGDRLALLAAARPADPIDTPRGPAPLPRPLTSLIGRERELADLRSLLAQADARLVTVTGAGGIGKTRLALEVASGLGDHFGDGIAFVDLAPLTDAALVLPAVAVAFGVRRLGGRSVAQALAAALTRKRQLLMLDNCEHLLAAAPDIAALLASCSPLSVFATSREPLRLRGEREYRLSPLALPDLHRLPPLADLGHNPCVALFVMRTEASDPAFTLTQENAPAVAAICHRVDGLPLAIELAAARVKLLPPHALLARLERRLPLLDRGARDAPERQRTLRGAIAWSYELLSPEQQTLFRRLGTFIGGWTYDAAEAVANFDRSLDVLAGLASLIDKNLARLVGRDADPRYQMLEVIREFAMEQLTATADEVGVREAHARYLLGQASGAWWAFPERAMVRDSGEWLANALTLPEHASPEARALALASAGLAAFNQGDYGLAAELAEASLDLSRGSGLDQQTGMARYVLLVVHQELGEFAQSAACGEESIVHFRRAGDQRWLSQSLLDTGYSAFLAGDEERAAALRAEGFALARIVGNTLGIGLSTNDLGTMAELRGDARTALAHYRESLSLHLDVHDEVYIAHPVAGMASIAGAAGDVALAARLLGAASFAHETLGTLPWIMERERDDRTAALARSTLGDERYARERAVGRTLSITDAARQALAAADTLARRLSGLARQEPEP